MLSGSNKAVATAIVANAIATVLKFLTAFAGGSPSMMNTAVHSLVNTLSQGVLFIGLVKAAGNHTFGHAQKRARWSLWSAIGLFSAGAGFGLVHAWYAWPDINATSGPALVQVFGIFFDPLGLALLVLCLAFIIEGYSFVVALKAFLAAMCKDGCSSPFKYLVEFKDPTPVTVLLGEAIAMLGLAFAIAGIGLSAVTGNPLWDVCFSAAIAAMLGGTAFYLGMVTMRLLAEVHP